MPPRLTENPYLAQPPDFEAEQLHAIYTTLATNDCPVETIIAELKEAWTQNNNQKKVAWDTQVEEDRAEEERQRLEQEAAATEAAAAKRKEKEKKKLKLKAFTTNKLVGTLTTRRAPKYALHKMEQFEYSSYTTSPRRYVSGPKEQTRPLPKTLSLSQPTKAR